MNGLLGSGYGSYPGWLVMTFGWGSLLCCLLGAIVLRYLPSQRQIRNQNQNQALMQDTGEQP
jgi:hypothetical protein